MVDLSHAPAWADPRMIDNFSLERGRVEVRDIGVLGRAFGDTVHIAVRVLGGAGKGRKTPVVSSF
jgi:hypothetical protein